MRISDWSSDVCSSDLLMAFYTRLKGAAPGDIDVLLDRVGLGVAAGRRVGTYSKGMRPRLGLAEALIGAPKLLLLGEPTSGLEPHSRGDFSEMTTGRASWGGRGCKNVYI